MRWIGMALAAFICGLGVSSVNAAPGDLVWSNDLGSNPGNEIAVTPSGDLVVKTQDDQNLSLLSSSTGAVRWSTEMPFSNNEGIVAGDAGRIYYAGVGGEFVTAVDEDTGQIVWSSRLVFVGQEFERSLGRVAAAPALSSNDVLYVLVNLNRSQNEVAVLAVDGASGDFNWVRYFSPNSIVGTSIAIGPGGNLFAQFAGDIFSIEPSNGNLRWSREGVGNGFLGFTRSGISIGANGDIYVPIDGGIVALDRNSGEEKWRRDANTRAADENRYQYISTPIVDERGVVYLAGSFAAGAYSPVDGAVIWEKDSDLIPGLYEVFGDPLVTANGTLYLPLNAQFDGDPVVAAIDKTSGEFLYSVDKSPSNPTTRLTNVTTTPDGKFIFGNGLGLISAHEGDGSTFGSSSWSGRAANPQRTRRIDNIDPTIGQSPADVSVTLNVSETEILAGESFDLSATVANRGSLVAEQNIVNLSFPSGLTPQNTSGCSEDPNGFTTCSLGTISGGRSQGFSVRVASDPQASGLRSITATLSTSSAESNASNNSDSVDVTLVLQDDLNVVINQINPNQCPDMEALVSVTDQNGDPIFGLDETNFTLVDNGVTESITVTPVSATGRSASIALVIDRSDSLSNIDMTNIKNASNAFLDVMALDDQIAVYSFNQSVRRLLDFTTDKQAARDVIEPLFDAGNTAFYDAIVEATEDITAINERKAIIVMTDGEDNRSNASKREAIEAAIDAGVPVFTVGFGDSKPSILRDIAEGTGGRYFPAGTSADLSSILQAINTQLSAQYLVEWTPTNVDGLTHDVVVSVTDGGLTGSDDSQYFQQGTACGGGTCVAERQLPDGYAPQRSFMVNIVTDPGAGVSNYAVEDAPPSGWLVTNISAGGILDQITGEVKWGPFDDTQQRTLSYTVTVPTGTSGRQDFLGQSSVDGQGEQICGDTSILEGVPHPADTNGDWSIEINEATSYRNAWLRNLGWPFDPTPIPLLYVTNASSIWLQGEQYAFDSSANPPYVPTRLLSAANDSTQARVAMAGSSTAQRTVAVEQYAPGQSIAVSVQVEPDRGVSSHGVVETLPEGWSVSAITEEGIFVPSTNQIRWQFSDNDSRTLSYTITPPAGSETSQEIVGSVVFDSTEFDVQGQQVIKSPPLFADRFSAQP